MSSEDLELLVVFPDISLPPSFKRKVAAPEKPSRISGFEHVRFEGRLSFPWTWLADAGDGSNPKKYRVRFRLKEYPKGSLVVVVIIPSLPAVKRRTENTLNKLRILLVQNCPGHCSLLSFHHSDLFGKILGVQVVGWKGQRDIHKRSVVFLKNVQICNHQWQSWDIKRASVVEGSEMWLSPARWPPTIVINGVIIPIDGLIHG